MFSQSIKTNWFKIATLIVINAFLLTTPTFAYPTLGNISKVEKELRPSSAVVNPKSIKGVEIRIGIPDVVSQMKSIQAGYDSSRADEIRYGDKIALQVVKEITPEIIEQAQNDLTPDQTDQNLRYIIKADRNLAINPKDEIFVGHFRDDRASYFAAGLQRNGFKNITAYIKLSDEFIKKGGISILSPKTTGEVSDNYFEILYKRERLVRIVSENEKKNHMGRNAHGRREKLWPNEEQVSIPMRLTTCEYADVPEMNTKKVADQIITWLDNPKVTDIYANMLSSDMMKHTGSFQAAKKGNEVTDENVGRIKIKIDEIRNKFLKETEDILQNYDGIEKFIKVLGVWDFNEVLEEIGKISPEVANRLKESSKKVPVLVLTADHGASEDGLKATMEESNTAHTANPVPYIIYDPLNKKKIPLKEGKTIRNNAPTLLHLLGFERPASYEESLLPDDYQGYERRIVEVILDGWGINPNRNYPYDAIRLARTPNYDWLVENTSFVPVAAHGEEIGLRKILSLRESPHHDSGLQPGQTDIGHLHFFSGRLIKQPIRMVDELIKGGQLEGIFDETRDEVKIIVEKMLRVKNENKKYHHIAFASEGGVHACLSHMYAQMHLAKKLGLRKDQFIIHFVAEGRDVLIPRSAHLFLREVQEEIDKIGIGVVASVFGRADWVRKDGYEHQTDRAIGAISGDFEKFIAGTNKMLLLEACRDIQSALSKEKLTVLQDESRAIVVPEEFLSDPSIFFALDNAKKLLGEKLKLVVLSNKSQTEIEALCKAIKKATKDEVNLKFDLVVPKKVNAKEVIKRIKDSLEVKKVALIGPPTKWTRSYYQIEDCIVFICRLKEGNYVRRGDSAVKYALLAFLQEEEALNKNEKEELWLRLSKKGRFFDIWAKKVDEEVIVAVKNYKELVTKE